ncbi:prolyl oligopeptidase family serine peptidase [Pseudoalteromonas rubra]|uniref:Prolyl oligopeptidase family serine peptidase n=1 Tax=Pseudoalteromonas rubra TaxID=43658 RepID=A0A5S3US36_9GAMM|nr:S9 family peptidase [Pseudoalteromonas rubra]QPB85553.1 prolyl oligopeptidase family serine peptidase [Pseudoalteromonas rubra]
MTTIKFSAIAGAVLLASACSQITSNNNTDTQTTQQQIQPPVAQKVPHVTQIHGYELVDNYHWLRDDSRSSEKVLTHLEQENRYADVKLAPIETLRETLFEEIKNKIAKDDRSVPYKRGDYYYFSEVKGDQEYRNFYRSKSADGSNATEIFNANKQAEGQSYYALGAISISPDGKLMAFAEDTLSRRIYTISIKNLETGEIYTDKLEGAADSIEWGSDNRSLYYIKKDPVTLLGYQVYRHVLGQEQSQDKLVYEEKDNTYYTYLEKSKEGSEIYIVHDSTEAKGVSVIDANNPNAQPQRLLPRTKGHEYSLIKQGDFYFIYTNDNAVNFKLMKAHKNDVADKRKWKTIIAHNPDAKLEEVELFNQHLVYQSRVEGIGTLNVLDLKTKQHKALTFKDPAYMVSMTGNRTLDSQFVRVNYQSLTTPKTIYDIDLTTLKKTQRKQTKVLGNFNANDYASERLFIEARDGTKVPVTLVYKKATFKKDGTNPLLQYGYGSYGSTRDPYFRVSTLSLLDRGFVYAIAHIRGSQALGRPWYEDGKKLNKKNTFNDFIDVTKALTKSGYGDPKRLYARGGSAGGLLMGAVINQEPELYHGVHSAVPFVDVINTMLDESLPLTTNEYDEWGNPNDKVYFDYMRSYSPYDQVSAQNYPNMLVTTGLHDSQVQYFEPAKWVAKLREYKTDDNTLLLKTDMSAGHGGASGRFKRIHDTALSYGFIIGLAEGKL